MKFQTKFDHKGKPYKSQIRVVRKFAWIPTPLMNGRVVWFRTYSQKEVYVTPNSRNSFWFVIKKF